MALLTMYSYLVCACSSGSTTYYVLTVGLLFRYELLELAAHLHVGVEVVGDLVVGDRALPARAHEQAAPRLPGDGVALERRAAALA
eukprot:scaffold31721_cov59-Phaeocystis_antarctica.AAC.2